MQTGIVPFKTPQGHDELARRTRRLGQRHRTVLLLVDGRRSVDQVLALARAAGVAEHHYRELVEMDLVALPEDALDAPTMPASLDDDYDIDDEANSVGHVDLPMSTDDDEPARTAARGGLQVLTEEVPAARYVATPSSVASSRTTTVRHEESAAGGESVDDEPPLPRADAALEQARAILLLAVRDEAPMTGQLTLIKLKRAADRAELGALLDEVEQRLSRPRKALATAQTMRHVRHLLGVPTSTSFTML